MQYYNIALSVLLLLVVGFVYHSKRFSPKAQAAIVFLILSVLMCHYTILMNIKLIRSPRRRYDDSFLNDLDCIKNTDQGVSGTARFKELRSCIDLNGKAYDINQELNNRGVVLIRSPSSIPVKSMVYNALIERYAPESILNFYMDFQAFTPRLSVFNLSHMEPIFLQSKISKEAKDFQVVMFYNLSGNMQLQFLLNELRHYNDSKLFIVFIAEDEILPDEAGERVLPCFDLDTEEFHRFVSNAQPLLKDVTTEEIMDVVGKNAYAVEKLFASKSDLTKTDLSAFIELNTLDLGLESMDNCALLFLKNMLVEYYKVNHKSEYIPTARLIQSVYDCGQPNSIRPLLEYLTREKVILSNGKTVKFYSMMAKNAVARHFRGSNQEPSQAQTTE